ncbi:MAG TPA: histidine kinase [Anaeromyxobacteraceae bacterium]|nr:histidine kinase [Anaeromyxobacteraceae bacterium]
MPPLARGAAVVDQAGRLLAADAGFAAALGLPPGDPGGALCTRAAAEPALAALLAGAGPDALALAGAGGIPLRLERQPGGPPRLLVVRGEGDEERLEHAARSEGLPSLAAGLAHDVNGPLHTMTLQLAILAEKLGDGDEGRLAAGHLGALREQVARVARMVRRFREVVDPSAGAGGLDLAALATEATALLNHDLHRRAVRLTLEVPPAGARTGAAPERSARLVLALLQAAATAAPQGGALAVAVEAGPERVALVVEHAAAADAAGFGYDLEVAAGAAEALGGRLVRGGEEGRVRVRLELPRGQQA